MSDGALQVRVFVRSLLNHRESSDGLAVLTGRGKVPETATFLFGSFTQGFVTDEPALLTGDDEQCGEGQDTALHTCCA